MYGKWIPQKSIHAVCLANPSLEEVYLIIANTNSGNFIYLIPQQAELSTHTHTLICFTPKVNIYHTENQLSPKQWSSWIDEI